MIPISGSFLDNIATQWAIVRGPGETDDHLRQRMLNYIQHVSAPNHHTQRLVYLLAKLGVARKWARIILPVGVDYGS